MQGAKTYAQHCSSYITQAFNIQYVAVLARKLAHTCSALTRRRTKGGGLGGWVMGGSNVRGGGGRTLCNGADKFVLLLDEFAVVADPVVEPPYDLQIDRKLH